MRLLEGETLVEKVREFERDYLDEAVSLPKGTREAWRELVEAIGSFDVAKEGTDSLLEDVRLAS